MPGGFGTRGTGGMVAAAEYARRTGTPYFGICYGFQWAVTEYARNVCGLAGANSTEVDAGRRAQGHLQAAGPAGRGGHGRHHAPGLLRLRAGARLARRAQIYGATEIRERHRHRYEFNKEYESCLTQGGLAITGKTPDGKFVEIAEVPGHPWYVAVQFHPEFKSKPLAPHPLFADFVRASLENRQRASGGDRRRPRTCRWRC